MDDWYDIAVTGAGIYGLMTAEKLAAAGQRVIVIDSAAPGHAAGASSGMTRAMHSLYDDPLYAGLAQQAMEAWRRDYPDAVVACGAAVFDTREACHAARILKPGAARYREITAADMRNLYPDINASCGCIEAQAGVLRLPVIRERLMARIDKLKISRSFGRGVTAIRPETDGFSLRLDDGEIFSRNLVICAGGFSQHVVDSIDCYALDLRLREDRPGLLHFYPCREEQKAMAENLPAFALLEEGIFFLPVVPGTADYIKIGSYVRGSAQRGAAEIREVIAEKLPFLSSFEMRDPPEMDRCVYDMTPDGDFIVGALPGLERVVIACGWNGGGYKFAPVLTDMIADYVAGGMNRFPQRFVPGRSA